ncbi:MULTISPECIES: hypothetical protein [unclassified Microcoleus]|uniref:hypothetical protein n=1 Tax=unclassified Microcoleus TaxID=2642155 RepID=UPI0025E170B6|nr:MULTISPECIES: hypothetical protein [unclassified Microcoleus]
MATHPTNNLATGQAVNCQLSTVNCLFHHASGLFTLIHLVALASLGLHASASDSLQVQILRSRIDSYT